MEANKAPAPSDDQDIIAPRPIPPSASDTLEGYEDVGGDEDEDEKQCTNVEENFVEANDRSLQEGFVDGATAMPGKVQFALAQHFGSRSSLCSSDTCEDDPRLVGMDNGIFGDYDIKKSPSTKDFLSSFLDDEMARRHYRDKRNAKLLPDNVAISNQIGQRAKQHLYLQYEEDVTRHDVPRKMTQQIFKAVGDVYSEGIESVVDDNFWKCFQSHKSQPWNWNAYLWPLWASGVIIRYCVLFPVRLAIFVLGWVLFGIGMFLTKTLLNPGTRRTKYEHNLISMMCGVFCITWGAVIRYHGSPHSVSPGQCQPVYVANHTSMIDVIILQQMRCFSLVGQRHKGVVRFLQEVVLGCLQCVWFDRGEIKDRAAVARKLKEHATDPGRNPLLVFPEGTCVNNEYVIQFKKGIFEIGAPVVPVAIKYNKIFVDPFWNSKAQSFPMHLVELMTSWCLICDVWYLEPQTRRQSETAQDFAGRVKKLIADKAGLQNVDWDGYMKYWKPSERYLHARQSALAKNLRKIYSERLERLKEKERSHYVLYGESPPSPLPEPFQSQEVRQRNIINANKKNDD